MVRVGSTFTGVGGIDLGFLAVGAEISWQVERDKRCQELLRDKFPEVELHDDITTVQGLRPVDALVGGFPCQDISIAGRRAGLAGERSGLFFDFARLAEGLRPEWLLIENVTGLLSSNQGRDMGTVLGTLSELGYEWAYRVLDAQFFGVPQRRRRVFIVGHLGAGTSAASVLFERDLRPRDSDKSRKASQSTAIPATASTLQACQHGPRYDAESAAGGHLLPVIMRWREGKPGGGKGELLSPDISLTLATGNDQILFNPSRSMLAKGEWEERWKPDGIHDALTAQNPPKGRPVVVEEYGVRRLTPLECERLQGFPDGWTEGFKDSVRYRMLGNAVCVNVAAWIADRMVRASTMGAL